MKGITVAVWGSPGSGKTTLCAALANKLTADFGNVLLVGADKYCPCFAQWYPDLLRENEKAAQPLRSLDNILNVPELTQEHIRRYVYLPRVSDCLGVIDYLPGEGVDHSEDILPRAAEEFLDLARSFAEVTVVDCTNPYHDGMSNRALDYCDVVLHLVSPTPKGLGFLGAMASHIDLDESDGRAKRLVISPQFPNSDAESIEAALGTTAHTALPYLEAVYRAEREKVMLKGFGGKAYQTPVGKLCALVKSVFDEKN